jgi:hypothetical protein
MKYTFYAKDDPGKAIDVYCRMDQLDEIIAKNPDWEQAVTAPAIVSGVYSPKNKPDSCFTDKIKEMKKNLPKRFHKNLTDWR